MTDLDPTCDLGPMHGFASTHTNADGVRCCDFCGHPVKAADLDPDLVERTCRAIEMCKVCDGEGTVCDGPGEDGCSIPCPPCFGTGYDGAAILTEIAPALITAGREAERRDTVAVDYWYEGQTGVGFGFDDGILNLNRDGSGSFCFRDEVLEFETNDESGKLYRYANIPASEMMAIRDELNKWFPPVRGDHTKQEPEG